MLSPVPCAAAGYIKNQMRFGAAANDSGRTVLKIPPERVPFMLSCTSVGYKAVSVPVDTAGRYRITIYMMPGSNGGLVNYRQKLVKGE